MCAFCEIVSGEAAAEIVYSDDEVVAFLDARPVFPGHTLVVPRAHHETLADLPVDAIPALFEAVQKLARSVPEAMDSPGSFVAMNNVVSQSVAHLHVHVVPRRFKDGLRGFFWPRTKYESDAHMHEVAEAIRSAVGTGS